jgi:translation initiation factor 2 subunit 2
MRKEAYEKLLDRAKSVMSINDVSKERFQPPSPSSSISGNRTILHNFKEISDVLVRDQSHLLKFLSGELATAGIIEGGRAIFQGRFEQRTLTRLINLYIDKYVICPVCSRPDTHIVKENRLFFKKCDACGAKSSIGKT